MSFSNLTATALTYDSIELTWTADGTQVGTVKRKPTGGTWTTIGTVDESAEIYTDSTVSGSVQYSYRIMWSAADANSSPVWTPPCTPGGLAVAYTGKSANLSWLNVGGVVYTYLKVYWKAHSSGTWTTDTEVLAGTDTTRSITVTAENTAYDFRIRGYYSTSTLNSDYNTIESQTSGIAAPTNCEATAESGTHVTVSWTDNSSVETGYEVYRDGTLLTTTAAGATSYHDESASASTSYVYSVRATTGTAYSDLAYADSITTGSPPDNAPVIGTVAVVSSSSLTVTWTDTATNATNFYIYRSTDDSTYEEIDNVEDGIQTYTDTGLASHTTYYYKVRAYNAAGWSAYTSSANNTTSLDLDPPTGLVATDISSTQITLTWTANAYDATTHNIERKATGGSYSQITTVAAGTSTYTDGSLTAGTEYTYRIRAYHSTPATYGEYSLPITKFITLVSDASVPVNVTYIAQGRYLCQATDTPSNQLDAYWTSKPLDMTDQDPSAAGRIKTWDKVELDYVDRYAYTPMTVSLSTDNGATWTHKDRELGTADGTSKRAIFWVGPVTGEHITAKLESNDDDTSFTITGLRLHYIMRGTTLEDQ